MDKVYFNKCFIPDEYIKRELLVLLLLLTSAYWDSSHSLCCLRAARSVSAQECSNPANKSEDKQTDAEGTAKQQRAQMSISARPLSSRSSAFGWECAATVFGSAGLKAAADWIRMEAEFRHRDVMVLSCEVALSGWAAVGLDCHQAN